MSRPDFHGHAAADLDAFLDKLTSQHRHRKPRPVRVESSPRCPVCHAFVSTGPSEYVGGVQVHRLCVREAA